MTERASAAQVASADVDRKPVSATSVSPLRMPRMVTTPKSSMSVNPSARVPLMRRCPAMTPSGSDRHSHFVRMQRVVHRFLTIDETAGNVLGQRPLERLDALLRAGHDDGAQLVAPTAADDVAYGVRRDEHFERRNHSAIPPRNQPLRQDRLERS